MADGRWPIADNGMLARILQRPIPERCRDLVIWVTWMSSRKPTAGSVGGATRCEQERSLGMDGVRDFLDDLLQHGRAKGRFLGLLHILIGRKITKTDGTLISAGLTWRAVAAELKRCRWPTDAVRELGMDPADFAPRDRQRFWYSVIGQAKVGSAEAAKDGDRLARDLSGAGYVVGPAPGTRSK